MHWRILLVFSLLFLAGCTSGESDSSSPSGNGVDISFAEDSPPDRIEQGIPFSVILDLENKGGYDIPAFIELRNNEPRACMSHADATDEGFRPESDSFRINATLSGIFYADVGLEKQGNLTQFPTASDDDDVFAGESEVANVSIEGHQLSLAFPSFTYTKQVENRLSALVRANVCYQYGVTATGLFCTLEDATLPEPFCDASDTVELEVSDGHVDVALEESVVGRNQFRLIFTLTKKSGDGVLLKPWTGDGCSRELEGKVVGGQVQYFNRPDLPRNELAETWTCEPPSSVSTLDRDRVFVEVDIGDVFSNDDDEDAPDSSSFSCRGFTGDTVGATQNGEDYLSRAPAGYVSLAEPATIVCTFIARGDDAIDAKPPSHS